MGYTTLAVTAPHATAYDEDYPTRSTENYAHALHNILQDMEDAVGDWYLHDDYTNATTHANAFARIHDMIEDAFDYVEAAIDTYRSTGTPTLAKPTKTTIAAPYQWFGEHLNKAQWECYTQCMKVCYFAYYMWKTEEDPLLLKEKLQELLLAWPLTDTEITLNEEGGQTMRITPAWKNVDI